MGFSFFMVDTKYCDFLRKTDPYTSVDIDAILTEAIGLPNCEHWVIDEDGNVVITFGEETIFTPPAERKRKK